MENENNLRQKKVQYYQEGCGTEWGGETLLHLRKMGWSIGGSRYCGAHGRTMDLIGRPTVYLLPTSLA